MKIRSGLDGHFFLNSDAIDPSPERDENWEVYVCHRPLREEPGDFYSSLPMKFKNRLKDLGLCHFMAIFRSSKGELVQFDFGPPGGDITISFPSSRKNDDKKYEILYHEKGAIYAGPLGEIREEKIEDGLPSSALFMGRTRLSLNAIREFNNTQDMAYQLIWNDCRHYVDMLVQHTTGSECASASLMRHYVTQKCQLSPRMGNFLTKTAQRAFEKETTALIAKALQTSFSASMAAFCFKMGQFALLSLRRFRLPAGLAAIASVVTSQSVSNVLRMGEPSSLGVQLSSSIRRIVTYRATWNTGVILGATTISWCGRKHAVNLQSDRPTRTHALNAPQLQRETRRGDNLQKRFNSPTFNFQLGGGCGKKFHSVLTYGMRLHNQLSLVPVPRSCIRQPLDNLALMVTRL